MDEGGEELTTLAQDTHGKVEEEGTGSGGFNGDFRGG